VQADVHWKTSTILVMVYFRSTPSWIKALEDVSTFRTKRGLISDKRELLMRTVLLVLWLILSWDNSKGWLGIKRPLIYVPIDAQLKTDRTLKLSFNFWITVTKTDMQCHGLIKSVWFTFTCTVTDTIKWCKLIPWEK